MSEVFARSYAGASDLPLLVEFAQRIAAAREGPPYYHPGDFVWQLAALGASDDVRLWSTDRGVVAAAIFEPPVTFQFDVEVTAPANRALFDEAVTWAERRHAIAPRGEAPIAYQSLSGALSTWAMSGDSMRVDWLEERGYTRSGPGGIRYAQSLDGLTVTPELPADATVRHVLPSELDERVELHRDAWSVWGASTFSLEQYTRLRAAPLYDAELDIVVEFDGRLVSYCVCWLDTANSVGYFEPVGTRPGYTGRGFGRAAILGGLERMEARGMTMARVGTASINVGAQALYRSAGFAEEAHEVFYSKK